MTIFVLQLFRFVIYQVHFKYKKLYRTLICENSAPSFETTYEESEKVRRSIYRRTSKALYGHGGLWKTVSNDEHRIIKDGKKQNGIQEIYLKVPNFDQGDTWGYSFAGNYNYVPRILECGKYVKSANAPAYATMDRRGFSNVKFYKYIKK